MKIRNKKLNILRNQIKNGIERNLYSVQLSNVKLRFLLDSFSHDLNCELHLQAPQMDEMPDNRSNSNMLIEKGNQVTLLQNQATTSPKFEAIGKKPCRIRTPMFLKCASNYLSQYNCPKRDISILFLFSYLTFFSSLDKVSFFEYAL